MTITSKHISKRLREDARASIDLKCKLLESWSRSGLPSYKSSLKDDDESSLTLEWFPTSLRAFCAWDGTQNSPMMRKSIAGIKRNAFQTLKSDERTCLKVEALIETLKRQSKIVLRNADPGRRAKEREQMVLLERQKRHGALLGYRAARRRTRELDAALSKEKRAHQETIKQFEQQIEAKNEEIVELLDRVARLTADMRKVAPIRRVR